MRRSKAEVERYIASVQSASPSPREKSMKGFFFAKLYFEAKEYELAKRYISTYLNVQERDPKAHKFLGHLYEIEDNIHKAVGCYKRSVELNPTQKDLVLKIAQLLCDQNVDDGRTQYWIERASKLFPGSPAVFKLKEKLLNIKGDVGWNQLFDLIQSELYARPDDVYVNIRLVELYRSDKRLEEAVNHCLNTEKKGALRTSLEWCSCVVHILKDYIESLQNVTSDKTMWRSLNRELLLAHCNLMLLTLSTRDVQEARKTFQSFDHTLQSVKPHACGTDDLATAFQEIRGHFYMHAATLLLKMAQESEAQWRAVTEPAALCYLIAFQVPRPKNKSIKRDENGQDLLELLACDRQSQSGHMLLNLIQNQPDFCKMVVETFANKSGQTALFEVLFENEAMMEQSFLGCDDIRSVDCSNPELAELARSDNGSIRFHNCDLHHLTWLGLQWHDLDSLPTVRKWLKQLFPRLPQETSKLDTNAPESICLLDLEVFLLGVIFTSHLQLQDHFNVHYSAHQPRCLPMAICKPLCTERHRSWWDAVYNLIHRKAQPGTSAKLRLLVQHELHTVRALEKHGLQPSLIIHWARNLQKTGTTLNSFYDQREYMGRCVYYWKKVLPWLEIIKKKRSIPEPVDPLFKHFHSQDIQVNEVQEYEVEAQLAFASLNLVDGNTEEAIQAFDGINNVVAYWNLALIFQRKAEAIENDSPEEQDECKNYLKKCREYLLKIIEDSFASGTVAEKLPVSIDSVKEMLDSVMQELGEYCGEESPVFNGDSPRINSEIKHSTPSPTKFTLSPTKSFKLSPKTPPRWVEDQKSLLQMLCHRVEALKNEVEELKSNNSNVNLSPHRWPSDSFAPDAMPDSYQGAQSFHGAPLTVSTSGPAVFYNQSPAYNSQYPLRTAAAVAPSKAPVYGVNRLAPQQHIYGYQQQMHTPPLQNSSSCVFTQEIYGAPIRFESPAPGLLSPRGDEYYNYSIPPNSANPPLPEPGYFTKPSMGPPSSDSKIVEFGKTHFGPAMQTDVTKVSPFITPGQAASSSFKFNSNFKSNDGDFTFTPPQIVAPGTAFTGSESLFGLLTSDKTYQDGYAVQDSNTDQKNRFNFGSNSISDHCLTDTITQSQNKTPLFFGNGDQPFSFQDPGKITFETPNVEAADRSHESDGGSIVGAAEDDGPHFEPVVPLPDKVEVKTGEEDEEELFSNRAKLFRFDAELKEWKERGIGIVKILRHTKSGKIRLLMRREQVLKICANHYINPDMTLKPNAGSDKSYVWHALDYADEMARPEQLAIRFKTPEEASLFKQKFEDAQKLLKELTAASTTPQQSVLTSQKAPSKEARDPDKSSGGSSNIALQFARKPGEWDCDVCCVRNDPSASVCVACQTPSAHISTKVTPASIGDISMLNVPILPKFTFSKAPVTSPSIGFSEHLRKKKGQWDCSVCLVTNEPTAKMCVACMTPNTGSVVGSNQQVSSNKFGSGDLSTSMKSDFGSRFSIKEGQWDCSVCLVRNEASSASCVSCLTPNPEATLATTVAFPSTPSFKFGSSSETSTLTLAGFGTQFLKKEGQWDCATCLVRNESSQVNCASCQTPNPSVKTVPSATLTSSAFTFGLKSKLSEPTDGQSGSGFKSVFPEGSFKFGTNEQTITPSTFKFQIPSSTSEAKTGKEGFSFSMPVPPGGFKFGIQEPNKNDSKQGPVKQLADIVQKDSISEVKVKPAENKTSLAEEGTNKQTSEMFFGLKANTFTFADLAKSSSGKGYEFGKKDPEFKGFSRAGEKLFSSTNNFSGGQLNTSSEQERGDELYQTEERDDIHFEPVVQLPEKVELVTGEEEEQVLYSQRVKLFRFDPDTSQWKERGVGNLKILRNQDNGKLRILMRREQVLKVCSNHWITTTMNLKPLSGSDRAWMWLANDFSDGDAKLEQLAAKFKTPEQAEEFRQKFEECQMLLLDIPLQTPHKLLDTGRSAQLIQKAEEMKTGLKDMKTFLTEDRATRPEEDCRNLSSMSNTSGLVIKPHAESTGPTLEWDNYDLRGEALDDNLDNSVYASPLASSPEKTNLFRFGDSTAGFNFSFQPVLSPSKSPIKLNQSRVSVGTDDESDINQEDEKDGQYFEPVVPLPDLVEVSSGEENEQVVFCHRAKLYRFDKDVNQWKEKGIGDIKILQNYDTKIVRVLMRRDQVLKLCANHRITPDLDLKPMIGTERAWVWTAHDFSEGEGQLEMFAVRFKLQDVADSFKQIFEEAKQSLEKETLLTPLSSRGNTPRVSPCGKLAVAVLEETTKERTDIDTKDPTPEKSNTSCSSATPTKAVVSPPKFVFGSDSVKNIFSCEKPTSFTFGSTLASGPLFGFSYTPSETRSEKKSSVNQDITVKKLDFSTRGKSYDISASNVNKVSGSAVVSSTLNGSLQTNAFQIPANAENKKEADPSDDVIFVSELIPTPEQKALAESLQLPVTFFCYKNRPDYTSDDEPDDEDFETAVKQLNGKLYLDSRNVCTSSQDAVTDTAHTESQECILVWEKRPTPEERSKAESLKLPPTFFCGISIDTDEDKDPQEDFDTEVRKIKGSDESPNEEVSSSADVVSSKEGETLILPSVKSEIEPDSTSDSAQKVQPSLDTDDQPVDLSIKTEHPTPDSTSQGLKNFDLFGFSSSIGQSFADIASTSSGDFAFGTSDANFKWQNTGEVVFKSLAVSKREDEEGDEEPVQNDEIHFDPIVSLPEVEVRSGEEDEEILFKERAKLYRWDRDLGQWKERGVGEIKILYHQENKYYRVLMRRDQVLKVCANHVISKSMDIQPLSTSNNALVWTAMDYSEGEGKVEQLAVRFKTQEMTNAFKKQFEECQLNLPEIEHVS
ncbi:hypothetical protein NDU88_006304 [Pleurodeles waltl]|uniref:E3 SUMO-protein ligase RanBP2 n=1 Tax=Pleurodeles waltl TaxID=8319 RepID=A0AAV7NRE6_PLEWA|nr:hypothetical protein NDU88_006304 [Pleurodeles waltl]